MEYLTEDIRILPGQVTSKLNDIRQMDKTSRDKINALNEEQKNLVAEMTAHAKSDPDFDEEHYQERYRYILAQRQEVVAILETQMKTIQETYDNVDTKIAQFDERTKKISHLLPHLTSENPSKENQKKKTKKKRESAADTPVAMDTSAFFDTNEPLYCICRQVSYGQMIGCENTECPIEWFHFSCVGIQVEPVDPWFCSHCAK
jgi:chromosome segregation ATPase